MEVTILNTKLEMTAIVDTFESIIWTDRYADYGDFEIYTSVNSQFIDIFKMDYYIIMRESDHVMIIEDIKINSDEEVGDRLIITGRSLESILDRRIIWKQTILDGNIQNSIKKILDENIITPTDTTRKIDNFIFEFSEDPEITKLTVKAQFTGDSIFEAIRALCDVNNIGFRITLSSDNKFVFQLYSGTDRSYDQEKNPYVIFSPNFENIINSNYLESKKSFRTVTLVAGEGEGSARKTMTVSIESGAGQGLLRREMFTDARDISSTIDGRVLTSAEYNAQLTQRGNEYLAQNSITKSFEGQVETTHMFRYKEDFFMGDIIQIANEYQIESKSRVTEVVMSQNVSGYDVFPTFTTIE